MGESTEPDPTPTTPAPKESKLLGKLLSLLNKTKGPKDTSAPTDGDGKPNAGGGQS